MKKILFISDFYANEMQGGAEIYDNILIGLLQNDDVKVVK